MKSWAERTREEAHLLNPPFCCVIVASACSGFLETRNNYLPYVLVFMVLPIVLHKHTRKALPRTTRTSVPTWLQENAEARIGFYERLMALKPHTREALRYGLTFDWMAMENSGRVCCQVNNNQINRAIRVLDGDAKECISSARLLGKWFGTCSSTETLMALWGISP